MRALPSAALALLLFGCAGEAPRTDETRLERLTELEGDETRPRFSPDGRRLAFAADGGGQRDVVILDLQSREIERVAATDDDEYEPRWSPSGQRIAYAATGVDGGRGVWVVDAVGGSPSRISAETDDAYRPRWSPEGDRLAFTVRGERGDQVWLSDADGRRQLSDGPAANIAYDWSPDGAYVLTTTFSASAHDIWAWPIDGGPPRQLTDHEGEEWWPAWSPDGDRVAFYTTWDDSMTEIWTVEVDSGELTRITDLEVEDFRPTWSPDGGWLVYSSDRASKSGLWRQPFGGAAVPVALEGRAGGLAHWGPDGRSIAFSFVTSKLRLYRVAREGGEPVAVTPGVRDAVEPSVSDDGTRIAYEGNDVGSEADLFVLDVASGSILRLTDETDYNARPSWSPDGTRLAFERSAGGGMRTMEVGLLSASGGTPASITETGYVRSPVWCGDEIVFTLETSWTNAGPNQLWAVPAAGGEPRQLTTSPSDKRSTDCTPDGWLAYHQQSERGPQLRVARLLENGTLSEPFDLGPGEGGRLSANGSELVFVSNRDGQPDVYVAAIEGDSVTRLTETATEEGWPDFLHGTGDVIYSANIGDRDIWIAYLD